MVAYVSFQGKIMLMPGWMKSTVRSIVVTKADGAVELISRESTQPGDEANLLGLLDQVDEGSDASVVPSPPASRLAPFPREVAPRPPGWPPSGSSPSVAPDVGEGSPVSRGPRPPGCPPPGAFPAVAPDVGEGSPVLWGPRPPGRPPPPPPPLSSPSVASDVEEGSLGVPGSSSGAAPRLESAAGCVGGRRRKRRARRVDVCPSGLPRSVCDHHWKDLHGRGQDAALAGDFSYVARAAAEAGCRKCVFDTLNADPGRAEEMVFSEGTGGWDAAAWADWGVVQAIKAGDIERARMRRALQDHLERMRYDGVFAVLGEFESEYLDSNPDDDEEDEDGLLALEDT